MTMTKEGDVLIHKETWEAIKHEDYYRDVLEQIEDLEAHYEAKKEGGFRPLEEVLKDIKKEKDV